ncbi:unnamed protein product [Prorocentrum cordatum]|uniref:Uncharacterized protein n=1 Tax=Prorocentrum cordatum TaxID=2364126 RepID=A0ABN9XXX3_9DINO|nr:unnamed protein product [Polarella glacialis]
MGLARAPTQRARTKGCDLQKKWNAWGTTGNTLSRPTVCHCGVTGTPISGATRPRWLETQEGKQEEEDDEDKEDKEEDGEQGDGEAEWASARPSGRGLKQEATVD